MLEITEKEILARFEVENPWWRGGAKAVIEAESPKRAYYDHFFSLITMPVRRAIIVMGPRRVGKTFMMRQAVAELIKKEEVPPQNILYVSLNTPTFSGLYLEKLLTIFMGRPEFDKAQPAYVIYDEIQYLDKWELHLKSLVDFYHHIKFIASGSAGAALKKKSVESGAGRFTDFLLPPLNFLEFLAFSQRKEIGEILGELRQEVKAEGFDKQIVRLNEQFLAYLNYGGFPEVVLKPQVKDQARQFVGTDIIDKVLLKDLPELYGIRDTHELNRLFTVLAFNTGHEISLEELAGNFEAKEAGEASKNTVKKYLEYLEAAFLIKRIYKVDENAKRLKKQYHFKVYLTNPSIRAALFGWLEMDDPSLGHVVETAVLNHFPLQPSYRSVHYARWNKKEIDFVLLDDARQQPTALMEVTWSDKKLAEKQRTMEAYALKHKIDSTTLLSYSKWEDDDTLLPVSYWCAKEGAEIYIKELKAAQNVLRESLDFYKKLRTSVEGLD